MHVLRAILLLSPMLGLAIGLWGNWAWLGMEHARMPVSRIPFFWLSEATALFWYLWFLLGLVLGRESKPRPNMKLVWTTFAVGFGVDLGVSVAQIMVEHAAHARAVAAVNAKAIEGYSRPRMMYTDYLSIDCTFLTAAGQQQRSTFTTENAKFPDDVREQVEAGQYPFDVKLTYDPEFPPRCWLAETDNPHHNRAFFVSLSTLLFSTMLGAIFILLREDGAKVTLPTEATPFLAVSLVLFLSGVAKLLFE